MNATGEVPMVDQELVDFAVHTARRAGELITEYFFAAPQHRTRKPDGTEVTHADLVVEEWYRDELARHFPNDGFYGEETGQSAGTSGSRWVVDPIQGTFWFVRGVPGFGTSLAYEDEHGPAVGVGHSPLMMDTVLAGRGLGCWIERGPDRDPIRRPACVSQRRGLTGAN